MDSCRKHLAAKRDPDLPALAAFAPPPSNKTSNKTFPGSLVPRPRLPRFSNFPFHFPFRGEKGSGPPWAVFGVLAKADEAARAK